MLPQTFDLHEKNESCQVQKLLSDARQKEDIQPRWLAQSVPNAMTARTANWKWKQVFGICTFLKLW